MTTIQHITVHQLAEMLSMQSETRLIDVRTPREYEEAHVPEAENVPLDRLSKDASLAGDSETVYVLCKSGGRASQACQVLAGAGGSQPVLVEGGTDAWLAAGLPVTRGRKAMSLERQVRIAAGSLVLTGLAVGLLVHPIGFVLSGFVGAGLIFAGVTDTCGMGLLLARMPWNSAGCQTRLN